MSFFNYKVLKALWSPLHGEFRTQINPLQMRNVEIWPHVIVISELNPCRHLIETDINTIMQNKILIRGVNL